MSIVDVEDFLEITMYSPYIKKGVVTIETLKYKI